VRVRCCLGATGAPCAFSSTPPVLPFVRANKMQAAHASVHGTVNMLSLSFPKDSRQPVAFSQLDAAAFCMNSSTTLSTARRASEGTGGAPASHSPPTCCDSTDAHSSDFQRAGDVQSI